MGILVGSDWARIVLLVLLRGGVGIFLVVEIKLINVDGEYYLIV